MNHSVHMYRFSPNGQYLAVGYEESCIDIYNTSKMPNIDRIGYCKGISSYVMWIDFSVDSKYLRVTYENKYRVAFTILL